jgi:segregation and condensation protein A
MSEQAASVLDMLSPKQAALALVWGQPLSDFPADLYIPPEALRVILEAFEGPLDLLLYLIRKQNLNILDIPMAKLTLQYMAYVDVMGDAQFELAAEYLLIAAMLIEIKSRMLLPRPPSAVEEELDPRAELVRRLLEYEQIKLAAKGLDALPVAGRDYSLVDVWFERSAAARVPNITPADLKRAWAGLLAAAKLNRHHLISREALSVRDQMAKLLRALAHKNRVEFTQLFDPAQGVPHLVVTFLALLEMAREQMLAIEQTEAFAPIYVQLTGLTMNAPHRDDQDS